ncbi:hypothetical protein B7463_g2277, partial [Scytalidium lignicola]
MSLHYLGIAHFPVLHQQFSPTTSKLSVENSPTRTLTDDNKDVLIERLNDLVSRVTSSSLDDSVVTAIHGDVDHIERLLQGKEKQSQSPLSARSSMDRGLRSSTDENISEKKSFWSPATPTRSISMHLPIRESLSPSSQYATPDVKRHLDRTKEVVTSTAALVAQLTTTVAELQARREESQHIHGLLILRAQKAADRILYLEKRLRDLEEDFEANQSELKYLRIQMQAIEVQCSLYLDPNEDEDLSQSIQNWKQDWETIDKRWKTRKETARVPANLDYPKIIIDGS